MKTWPRYSSLVVLGYAMTVACTVVDGDAEPTGSGGTPPTGGQDTGGTVTDGGASTGGSAGATVADGGVAGASVDNGGIAGSAGDTGGDAGGAAGTAVNGGGVSGSTVSDGGIGGVAGAVSDGGAAGAGNPTHESELVTIPDGVFVAADAPTASGEYDGEQITELTGPGTVTNGGTFTLTATIPDATGEQEFVVVIEGDNGHFTTTQTAGDGGVFDIDFTLSADLTLETITARVAPVDADGDVGDYATITLTVVQSGTGDVKVTLSFDQDTDLDLHVTEPDGTQIYYDAPQSASGGQLDLDSNPGCSTIDGINIENIFWPTGSAPVGEYVVNLQYYAPCVAGTVDYTVTVSLGDRVIETVSGTVDETDVLAADGDPAVDDLIEVVRFNVE